jgi:anhydro-N-acetylmuramic acid kinase
MIVAGIMSGTSLDGIDVAVVEIRGRKWKVLSHKTTPYPRTVRGAILAVSNAQTHTGDIARLHFLLGELYADAVPIEAGVELIGCHGQTIFHEGAPVRFHGRRVASTLQIGEAAIIAERTGVPVVSDFRPRDIAAGGRGAPLVPFVDYFLYRHPQRHRVALNIGGIANVTIIPAGARPEKVIAFDTGPGNMVIDALVSEYTNGRKKYDTGGKIARSSKANRELINELTKDSYYSQPPPKTSGREQYGREFIERLKASGLGLPELIATATLLTATTISIAVRAYAPNVDELIVSGGGAHNDAIMTSLRELFPVHVTTSADFGIDPDAKEAIAFAILAYETWRRRPSNLPSATGARHPAILGKVTY